MATLTLLAGSAFDCDRQT